MFAKTCLFLTISLLPLVAADEKNSEILEKLLALQIAGDCADYENATPEWRLVMEARIRHSMFTYWIHMDKFDMERSSGVEARFGDLVRAIQKTGAFERTFVEPAFIRTASSFPVHAYVSTDGERFEISSREIFTAENARFLEFLKACATGR